MKRSARCKLRGQFWLDSFVLWNWRSQIKSYLGL